LAQEATATFICRKIYRFFVNEKVNEQHVTALAKRFRSSNYDIGNLMYTLFSSDWFYANENVANRIKSPVELLAGLIRQLGVSEVATMPLLGLERALGQVLFRPPNVAGWPGGRAWIDNSTLLLRLNLGGAILRAGNLNYQLAPELEQEQKKQLRKLAATINLAPLETLANANAVAKRYEQLGAYLLAGDLPPNSALTRRALAAQATEFTILLTGILALPEYQLC
ncbi:MAG: DUF1800 family protein, partial [Bacteroidota bacterium]